MMKVDGVTKVCAIAVSAGHALDLLDLGVEALCPRVGDAEHVGVEDAATVA